MRLSLPLTANQSQPPQAVPHGTRAFGQPFRNVLLRQARVIQCNKLSRLSRAKPRMSYALASLSDQPKDTAFGKPIPLTKLGGGCPRHVLGDHALDRLSPQPLADPTFSASVRAPNRLSRRRTPCVRQQGRVQFESPQADHIKPGQSDLARPGIWPKCQVQQQSTAVRRSPERLPQPSQGLLPRLRAGLGVDLHRHRLVGMAENPHDDPRVHIKINEERRTGSARHAPSAAARLRHLNEQ